MLAEILLAAAVALAPATAVAPEQAPVPTRGALPVQGTVIWKWYDSGKAAFLWHPAEPECWGMQITAPIERTNGSVCVDRATWERTPLFSHFDGPTLSESPGWGGI